MNTNRFLLVLLLIIVFANPGFSQINLEYQEPPEEIKLLADATPAPYVVLDDEANWMILLHRSNYKTIEEVSAKEYRLAGLRINPKTNGYSRTRFYTGLSSINIKSGEEKEISGIPEKALIGDFSWSPDYNKFAFTVTVSNGIELWLGDIKAGSAKKLTEPVLNDVFFGSPYRWMKNEEAILIKTVASNRPELVSGDIVPSGPVIQENLGQKAPARTYQDLLKNGSDEQNFDRFALSELKKVTFDGSVSDFAKSAIYMSLNFSPDGRYLLATSLQRPYSYLVPYSRFASATRILDSNGNIVKELLVEGLEESRPKGFMATKIGPRRFAWRADKPSTIYWAEAMDQGDPQNEVDFRDAVYSLDAPFNGNASLMVKSPQRFRSIQWGNDNLAILYDYWWNTRSEKVYSFNPSETDAEATMLFDLDTEDGYADPGSFVSELNKYNRNVLLVKGDRTLYLTGEGQSPEGNRPFVDAYDIKTKRAQRLWRADGIETYERIVDVINIQKGQILTRIESKTDNPNYYIRNIQKASDLRQITSFPNPYESLKGVKKELISYKRSDGTDLTAVLYLPANYDPEKDGRLPMFLWAYPREFKNAKAAGQVKDSPHRFTNIAFSSPIYWVNRGYAVLDRTDFPVIGEGDEEPNDTFVEQLVANGQAAIDKVYELGIADPSRVGVAGHSYGAFMTANLLAHSDIFATGIARSGAYNRTLTPFGFQREERTFWEAPEIYFQMSPFMHASKVDEPLLLIHGAADNNSGTFPMQSERMYNAVKGHGGTVRLVMLPNESHGYVARESVMHMLWEMDNWLETYVKNKKPIKDTEIDTLNKE